MKTKKLQIGIDPGVNTGYAVYHDKQLLSVQTVSIIEAMNLVMEFHVDAIHVRVEDARLRNWFGNSGKEKLQGAGSIKRDCQIWEEFLKANNISHEFVAPKNNKTKLNSQQFKLLTKYPKRTNEHGRDAAMLVFGA